MLTAENIKLFAEQVGDHIDKLNNVMVCASGDAVDEADIRKVHLTTRLLVGSTSMLGYGAWSRTLESFRNLLERSLCSGIRWNESLSQIVSELLEAEEHVAAEIASGHFGEDEATEAFQGINREIDVLISETCGDARQVEVEFMSASTPADIPGRPAESVRRPARASGRPAGGAERPPEVSERPAKVPQRPAEVVERPARASGRPAGGAERPAKVPQRPAEVVARPAEGTGVSTTLDTLIASLAAVRDKFRACVEKRDRDDQTIADLENAIGQSEFLFDIVREIVGHVADSRASFAPNVSCGTVLGGVRDFFDVHVMLRGWQTELAVRSDEIVLDGEVARSLAEILECCLFDLCTRFASDDEFSLRVMVDISNRGSFLEARIFDNSPEYLCDGAIETEDAAAFYKGLPRVRNRLERHGGMLWIEPDEEGGERFRFTLPCHCVMREYRIVEAAGIKLAVPAHGVEEVIVPGVDEMEIRDNGRFLHRAGRRIPLYRLDELAETQEDRAADGDRIVIVGLAEKRISLFVKSIHATIKVVPDQITEGAWACLCARYLHCGEEEYPLLDVQLLLDRMEYLDRLDRVPETPGSFEPSEECEDIDENKAAPRAYTGAARSLDAEPRGRTERTERLSW